MNRNGFTLSLTLSPSEILCSHLLHPILTHNVYHSNTREKPLDVIVTLQFQITYKILSFQDGPSDSSYSSRGAR